MSKISELIISNNLGEFVILIFSLIIDIASILFSIKITFSGLPLEEASIPKAPVPVSYTHLTLPTILHE